MRVLEEEPRHREGIRRVIADAFGRPDEARLVDELRTDGDLLLSLVWEEQAEVCGHAALSRLASPDRALALAPVSVLAARQRQGIGTALIREAAAGAARLGYDVIFVLGNPAYYSRFGFSVEAAARYPCPYAGPHFMVLSLTRRAHPVAPVVHPAAFARHG
jgi:putative acetyltransferase